MSNINKSIAALLVFAVFAIALASATVGIGYRSGYYQPYPYASYGSGYGSGYGYGYGHGPAYRGYSVQGGAVPAYSSYQPYYAPHYGYGQSYYSYPYAKA